MYAPHTLGSLNPDFRFVAFVEDGHGRGHLQLQLQPQIRVLALKSSFLP